MFNYTHFLPNHMVKIMVFNAGISWSVTKRDGGMFLGSRLKASGIVSSMDEAKALVAQALVQL